MIAPPLLAHVAQRVFGAALLELVQHDHVGEVEHVDLLELAGGAVFGGHHVQRDVRDVDDLGVALPDAGGLDHDQIESRRRDTDAMTSASTALVARCCRRVASERMNTCGAASEFMRMRSPSKRAAGTAPRGIDRHHGDLAIRKLPQEPLQQLVGQRALARAAGTRESDDGRGDARPCDRAR